MRFDILTLFPQMITPFFEESILGRAIKNKAVSIKVHDIRAVAEDRHRSVDDRPYGGGVGMVLRVDVIDRALRKVTSDKGQGTKKLRQRIILLTPQGERFTQEVAERLANDYERLILIAGHYEGFDERIRTLVDEEISLGDFVLTGGELPALTLVDAISRLVPGVLEKGAAHTDSFTLRNEKRERLLEYPHYTFPREYNGMKVPDILVSGDHAKIEAWRLEQAKERTENRERRTEKKN
jgi:tRNA (guanine37-N1)-methyltransferase